MPCFVTKNAEETIALAKRLGASLLGGELIAFCGGMGVGKTTFCRGLAQGLGVLDEVSSPSYAIAHYYRGTPALAHFDAWRIEGLDDLEAASFFDYLDQGVVVALEWSEKIEDMLDVDKISVSIRVLPDDTREIYIEGANAF